jgi:thymidylate synthase (FAD)
LDEDKKSRIPNLINMLWSNGHETPFEKGVVHFLVDTEIASHIHLLKHRLSSLNAESARYKELKEDKFYIPEDWKGIKTGGPNENPEAECGYIWGEDWADALKTYTEVGNNLYHECLKDLTPVLGRKRAKESARFFKTYNSQIQADVMFNMRSFANFLKLRNSEHSQTEIREIAAEMLELVKNIEGNPFEHTIKAWGY